MPNEVCTVTDKEDMESDYKLLKAVADNQDGALEMLVEDYQLIDDMAKILVKEITLEKFLELKPKT